VYDRSVLDRKKMPKHYFLNEVVHQNPHLTEQKKFFESALIKLELKSSFLQTGKQEADIAGDFKNW
jgi:hypothetical protein